jgi:hypothetical protein
MLLRSAAMLAISLLSPVHLDGGAAAQGAAPSVLLLRAAPDSGSVYLSWNDIPGAQYSVRWRQQGVLRWKEIDVPATTSLVPDLTNDRVYEFQVVASRGLGQDIRSDVVRMAPRVRSECFAGKSGMFCSVNAVRAYLSHHAAAPYLQCGDVVLSEIADDIPNCWYRSSRGTTVLNRFFGADYVAPAAHPSSDVIRRVARHALWPTGDPFTSPASFSLQLIPLPAAHIGKVDPSDFDEANSHVIDYGFELKSRVTWFKPVIPVKGRYAIYSEGHGYEAVLNGSDVIKWLLHRGWQVIAIDMPLTGVNSIDRNSPFTEHEDLGFEFARSGAPMDAFLLPQKAVVDSIYRELDNPEVLMVGRSGGAAMGSIYSMLDQRVAAHVNIAGGAPETMVYDTLKATQGDYEQYYAPLVDVLPRDLQLLAGGQRGSFFFYSKFDTCCFRFDATDSWIQYLDRASGSWGKTVQVSLDTARQHGLSEKGFEDLDQFLKSVRLWSPVTPQRPVARTP